MPVLWFWPNVDAGSDGTSKGIRVFREREKPDNLHLFRNMFPEDFLRLLRALDRASSATPASRSASARSSACRR